MKWNYRKAYVNLHTPKVLSLPDEECLYRGAHVWPRKSPTTRSAESAVVCSRGDCVGQQRR